MLWYQLTELVNTSYNLKNFKWQGKQNILARTFGDWCEHFRALAIADFEEMWTLRGCLKNCLVFWELLRDDSITKVYLVRMRHSRGTINCIMMTELWNVLNKLFTDKWYFSVDVRRVPNVNKIHTKWDPFWVSKCWSWIIPKIHPD